MLIIPTSKNHLCNFWVATSPSSSVNSAQEAKSTSDASDLPAIVEGSGMLSSSNQYERLMCFGNCYQAREKQIAVFISFSCFLCAGLVRIFCVVLIMISFFFFFSIRGVCIVIVSQYCMDIAVIHDDRHATTRWSIVGHWFSEFISLDKGPQGKPWKSSSSSSKPWEMLRDIMRQPTGLLRENNKPGSLEALDLLDLTGSMISMLIWRPLCMCDTFLFFKNFLILCLTSFGYRQRSCQ